MVIVPFLVLGFFFFLYIYCQVWFIVHLFSFRFFNMSVNLVIEISGWIMAFVGLIGNWPLFDFKTYKTKRGGRLVGFKGPMPKYHNNHRVSLEPMINCKRKQGNVNYVINLHGTFGFFFFFFFTCLLMWLKYFNCFKDKGILHKHIGLLKIFSSCTNLLK